MAKKVVKKKVRKQSANIVKGSVPKTVLNKYSKTSREENKVFATKHYDNFGFFDANRPTRESHVLRLMKSFEERYIPHPIIVTPEDKLLLIADGQHRFKAAKNLGYYVYFMIVEDLTIDDVVRLNARMSQWNPSDYLHSYVERKFEHYLILNSFRNEDLCGEVSISDCIGMVTGVNPGSGFYFSNKRKHMGGSATSVMDKFRDGNLVITPSNLKAAKKFAGHLLDFSNHLTYWKNRNFIHAVKILYSQPRYNQKQMINKIKKYKADMPTMTTNVINFGKHLEWVYNKNQNKNSDSRIYCNWGEIEATGAASPGGDRGGDDRDAYSK